MAAAATDGAGAPAVDPFAAVSALAAEPGNAKPRDATLKYGTAGFRCNADLLASTALRMGAMAALVSRKAIADAGSELRAIGVMVTASHNPVQDNGLKITDASGGMLEAKWEAHATKIANAENTAAGDALRALAEAEGVDMTLPCAVFIARDTRPSSEMLATLVREGAIAAGADILDFGLLTTPQLHHTVRYFNTDRKEGANEAGYFEMLRQGFLATVGDSGLASGRGPLLVDGAHGIGAAKIPALSEAMAGLVELEVRNPVGEGELNSGCGAEHAQKSRTPPHGFSAEEDEGRRLCSLDGDADRLVYHHFTPSGWKLLDGDRIAALAAVFIKDCLQDLGWTILVEPGVYPAGVDPALCVSVGVVQTAYANGASTRFIRDVLKLPVPLAKTGVKYVHHKATEFDIGVYFEANGHGTILFQPALLDRLRSMPSDLPAPVARARGRLLGASVLVNQAIGDALSDAMFCEAVLHIKHWTLNEWDGLYSDLPSRQTKLAVADRSVVVTTDDETRVVSPEPLQAAIDALVAGYEHGRAFVRPSGTEDVVRVYAEASTAEAADALALAVANAAFEHAGGVGEPPSAFKA